MDKAAFKARVPQDDKDLFWNSFKLLQMNDAVCEPFYPKKKDKVTLGTYHVGCVVTKCEEQNVSRSGNNGMSEYLWRFLLDILSDPQYRCV